MEDDRWRLVSVADFFYLLVDVFDRSGKSVLQKRLKKDAAVLGSLYRLIEKIDELGYADGVDFAFSSKRFDTIRNRPYSLIEIRRLGKTWRVVAYWDREARCFVMLDAFEAHKHKDMSSMLRQVEPLADLAIRLLKEDGELWR